MSLDGAFRAARRSALPGVLTMLCVGLLASCQVGSDEQRTTQNELLVRTLIEAFERGDSAAVLDIFQPDATYDDYPNQIQYRGLEEILDHVTSLNEWGDDVYMNIGSVHASPSGAVAEWLLAAVQSRPIPDLVPEGTDNEVVLNGVTIIEVQGGRISRAADYADLSTLMLQVGGRIELPGGNVLELDGSN